jgi:hypothetical protein
MAKINVENNADTGSINLPKSVKVGDRLKIAGREVVVTYIMQSKPAATHHHCCFGKQKFVAPLGNFEVETIEPESAPESK